MKQALTSGAKIYIWPELGNLVGVPKIFFSGMASTIGMLIGMSVSMCMHAQPVSGQNLWQEIAQVALDFNETEDQVQVLAYLTSLIDVLQTGTTVSASLADQLLDDTCEVAVALDDVSEELSIIKCKMEALASIADQAEDQLQDIENVLESDLDIFDGVDSGLQDVQAVLEGVLADLSSLESNLDDLDDTLQNTESRLDIVESIFDDIEQSLEPVERAAHGAQDLVEDIQSTLEAVESTMDLVAQEADTIQSLADEIEQTTENSASTLESIEEVVGMLEQEITDISSSLDSVANNVDEAVDRAQDIEDIFGNIASNLDAIEDMALDVENALEDSIHNIESSLDTIESIIDTLEEIESVIDEVTSQVETLDSAVDVAVSIIDSNESVVCIISSIIENIASATEVIESKVDVESSLVDLIESNVDILLAQGCTYLIYQADVDAQGGTYVITQPGTYCLAESIIGTIRIDVGCVVLDLNNHAIMPVDDVGIFVNHVERVVVKNGWVKGSETGGTIGVLVSGSSDVLVKDMRIVGMSNFGILLDVSHCIAVERCIMDSVGAGVVFQVADECVVRESIIRGAIQAIILSSSRNNCVSNCVILNCAVSYNDLPDGSNNICVSSIALETSQGFSPGFSGVVRDSTVLNSSFGFGLQGQKAIVENGIAINISATGVLLGSDAAGTKGNYISGAGIAGTIGIANVTGTDVKVFNNLVQNFDLNYSAVDLATIEFTPDPTTRFWANLSRAQV